MQIPTPRLLLKRPVGADAPAIFERFASDPAVTRYVGWPTHGSIESSRAFVNFSDGQWERGPAGPYLIFSKENGSLLGATGLNPETPRRAATGYVLAKDAWGRGYATEALGAIVELAPALGIRRLYALCHPNHRPSQRVLEKCGFELEGTLRSYTEFPNLEPGVLADVLCYSRIFPARRAE